tara:strand:+ start:367 stop:1683 length:1317 start_codon:yes stop_codon:yes gene_type:complete
MSKKAIGEITEMLLAGMASGLKWKVTTKKPEGESEIHNQKLASMLQNRLQLTVTEWSNLNIPLLHMGHYVHTGGKYFKPSTFLKDWRVVLLGYMTDHRSITNLDWGDAFKTSCSRQNYVSKIRRHIFDNGDNRKYHKLYDKTMGTFLRAVQASDSNMCKENAELFQNADFRVKYKMLKRHKRMEFCLDDANVDEAFRAIKLLTPRIDDFRTSASDWDTCRRLGKQRTHDRNRRVVTVEGSMKYLSHAREVVKTCTQRTSLSVIGFALMLTSGRRMSEIFNGKSYFRIGSNACSAFFTGQLKTDIAREYEIPLLCRFEHFAKALGCLRQRQGDVRDLTNDEVNARYSSNLNKILKSKIFFPQSTNHDCRRFYVQAIWKGYEYEGQHTFNAVAMQFLGHSDIQESLNYNHLLLGNFVRLPSIFETKNKLTINRIQKVAPY